MTKNPRFLQKVKAMMHRKDRPPETVAQTQRDLLEIQSLTATLHSHPRETREKSPESQTRE